MKNIIKIQGLFRRAKARRVFHLKYDERESYKRETKYFTREELFETLASKFYSYQTLLEKKHVSKAPLIEKRYAYKDGSVYRG